MNAKEVITVSQEFYLHRPKKMEAIPVSCDEWDVLKKNIKSIDSKPEFFHEGAWALLGLAIPFGIQVLVKAYLPEYKIIYMSAMVSFFVISMVFFWVAKVIKDSKTKDASDVVSQMELIEKRYFDYIGDERVYG